MQDITAQLEQQYSELQDKINQLDAGECSAQDVKKLSSGLGIYKERNDTYMLRIRRTAGETSPQNCRDMAEVMDQFGIDHAHFSTRQNIQMHGVPGKHVADTIRAFNARGLNFRGGGGNTFRNVATSPLSGVSATETFDTIPHTYGVWNWVYYYEPAYHFGRKFKLGFTSEEKDDSNAGIQDLGFVAKIKDGQRGFRVWGGGGMGRGASLCMELFEFLPEKDIIRVSQAMIDLFHDHGDRENRGTARLRFVLQKIGPDAFKELFMSYYAKATAPDFVYEPIDYSAKVAALKTLTATDESAEFKNWVTRTVSPTKFGDDIVSVRLFIRRGNFAANDFRALAEVLEAVGSDGIRVTIEQDGVIPLVHRSALPTLFALLRDKLPAQAVTDGKFNRHVVSCIGAAECPIGILKSPIAAEAVAEALDDLFEEHEDVRSELYHSILDGINISGCASSCGLNLVAGIGFHGQKKKINGELMEIYQVHVGGRINELAQHLLAKTDDSWLVKADDVPNFVTSIVGSYIESYKAGNKQTLREFMVDLRDSFDPVKFGGLVI